MRKARSKRAEAGDRAERLHGAATLFVAVALLVVVDTATLTTALK